MAYPNKTYVCFDADNDMESFLEMTSWCDDERPAINIHNIHAINTLDDSASPGSSRRKLREHLAGTRVLIVLIGGKAEGLYKYVRWEIEYAVEHKLPIIAANLNDTRRLDPQLCPSILKTSWLSTFLSAGRSSTTPSTNGRTPTHLWSRRANRTTFSTRTMSTGIWDSNGPVSLPISGLLGELNGRKVQKDHSPRLTFKV